MPLAGQSRLLLAQDKKNFMGVQGTPHLLYPVGPRDGPPQAAQPPLFL
ncbi:hypothetical protein BN844_1755 [Pseudomonas sp. SHC52]|nr:hypothetical protein BN844_1755 [Pseudomonas sp. SHC52]